MRICRCFLSLEKLPYPTEFSVTCSNLPENKNMYLFLQCYFVAHTSMCKPRW